MSDRFYTTIDVSGPNAATAEKAAIEAITSNPMEEVYGRYGGGWVEPNESFPRGHYCDHNSGEEAVQMVTKVSRNFPTETFEVFVNGDFGAGIQGHVEISNGQVKDGRCE